jgi:hypothetical protein
MMRYIYMHRLEERGTGSTGCTVCVEGARALRGLMNQVERRTRSCPFAVASLWPNLENQVKSFEHTTNGKRLLAARLPSRQTLKGQGNKSAGCREHLPYFHRDFSFTLEDSDPYVDDVFCLEFVKIQCTIHAGLSNPLGIATPGVITPDLVGCQ